MRSYETSGSPTTSKSRYRPKSNRSTSRSIFHVDRSTRRPNSRKRSRSRETLRSFHINGSEKTSRSRNSRPSTHSHKDTSASNSRNTSGRRSTSSDRSRLTTTSWPKKKDAKKSKEKVKF